MRPQGFSKAERVRRSDDFTRILKEGKRQRGPHLDVRWCEADERTTDQNRVGIAVGRRIGNAVIRKPAEATHSRSLPSLQGRASFLRDPSWSSWARRG